MREPRVVYAGACAEMRARSVRATGVQKIQKQEARGAAAANRRERKTAKKLNENAR